MASEVYELEGAAICGVGPQSAAAMVSQLPTTVRLGRIRPKVQPSCLSLGAYFEDRELLSATLPTSINRRDKAAAALARVYMNDQEGCCVISGKGHAFGVWSANDSDSGGEIIATDKEIHSQYQQFCGPGDRGCNIASVLDIIRTKGIVLGGKTYKIDGYVSVDWTKKDLVKAAQVIFGANTIGFDLPQAWLSQSRWSVSNAGSRIAGGHDVTPIDYDDEGVYVSSWGRIYLFEWEAYLSRKWISEMYAMLAPAWYGADMIAPTGMKVDQLKEDLQKIGSGVIPEITDPVPPGPEPAGNIIRLTRPLTKGSHADGIVLGSDLPAGDYDALLIGEGPPPNVP